MPQNGGAFGFSAGIIQPKLGLTDGTPGAPKASLRKTIASHNSQILTMNVNEEANRIFEEFMANRDIILKFLKYKDEFLEFITLRESHGSQKRAEVPAANPTRNVPASEQSQLSATPTESPDAATLTDVNDQGGEWLTRSSKKRKTAPTVELVKATEIIAPARTVVLKPTGKQGVEQFTSREVYSAIKESGVVTGSGLTVHCHKKPNTIAITTRNPLLVDKLMKINKVQGSKGDCEITTYEALASNHVRGVIYLRGSDIKETPETLMDGLDCNTHRIVAARPMGRKGTTVLVTFEGRTIPKYVKFLYETIRVSEYNPRPLICYNCHQLGHKADVCPSEQARCKECGHPHGNAEECELTPKCVNCGGPHLATSNDCPKRQWVRKAKRPQSTKRQSMVKGTIRNIAPSTTGQDFPPLREDKKDQPKLPERKNAWNKPFTFKGAGPQIDFGWNTQESTLQKEVQENKERLARVEGMLKTILQVLGANHESH